MSSSARGNNAGTNRSSSSNNSNNSSSSSSSASNKSKNSSNNNNDMYAQAMATRQETVQHLRNAVAITSATEELGTETLSELSRQGETIERTQQKVDKIDAASDQSKFMLRGIQSVWGSIKNKFSKKPEDAEEVAQRKALERQTGSSTPSKSSSSSSASQSSSSSSSSSSTSSVQRPGMSTASTEEEDLLQAISANVSRIGQIGQAMSSELDKQDKQLDTLTASVDKAGSKVQANAKKARQLTK